MKKPKVDQDLCTGCGVCVTICPEVFELDPETGKSKVVNEEGCDTCDCEEAKESCPVEAISLIED